MSAKVYHGIKILIALKHAVAYAKGVEIAEGARTQMIEVRKAAPERKRKAAELRSV